MTNTSELVSSKMRETEVENLLESTLVKLSEMLEQENERLESGVGTDHTIFITSKNQVLRELMAIQRTVHVSSLTPDMAQQLKATRKLVDRNHQLLKLQVSALNDVTTFLTQTAIAEQSDGTYTRDHQ
jgi:hypothetical protein